MAVSKRALTYCRRGIIQYLNGNSAEFERLVNKAMEFNKVEPKWTNCKYWNKGQKVNAKIDFSTGVITDLEGNVLRRGARVC
jgi:hypothetical protein